MATENFKKAGEIFQNAIEIEYPAKRARYLENACKEDPKLRVEVEALLKAHGEAGSFLDVSDGPSVTLDGVSQIEGPGTKIGRYELLELIGEGGMGLVYMARQKKPVKRKVALKIIKPGMDSKQVVARFEAEKQALAVLDHPNIAHVFDAGTTKEGRPYFIMEYVKGMSITAYCDEHKLNIEKRLRLFEQVCEGIHHAHQKGIIHRDIKPTNILVSVHGDRAVPKIIDFGIAKAVTQPLTEKTFVTFQGQLLGTPEYMSPEQVDMATQDIDTRSDIYSLGVLLYELLAGVLPFDRESFASLGFAEVQRTIREQEPDSPSTRLTNLGEKAKTIAASRDTHVVALARRLHRELEWIPLKAMRKDRCRRYKSASEMTDDIRNYLNGNPLIAGPETAVYRTRKFMRKHAGSVATAALVAVVIVLGLVASIVMGCRAERARQQEATARKQVEQALVRAENAEKVAQEQRKLAEEQRRLAEKQRMLAEERAEDYRRSLYINRISLAETKYHEGNIRVVRELLDACDEDLRGWEWRRMNHISDQAYMTLHGHTGKVIRIAVSPDGKRIASGSADKTVKVWETTTGAEIMTLRGHEAPVGGLAFSADGQYIASGSVDKTIKIWNSETGHELRSIEGHESWVNRLCFSPDDSKIISASNDKTIRVWDVDSGEELSTLQGHDGSVLSVAVSPDGRRIISGSTDNTIKIWDVENGQQLTTLPGHESYVTHVALSPDGKYVVSASGDRTIKKWDAVTGDEVMTLMGHNDSVWSAKFTPDGRHIVSSGYDGTVRVWDAATGEELRTLSGHTEPVASIAMSRNGQCIISGSFDRTIKLWDMEISKEAMTLRGHSGIVWPVAFSPDGEHIVSGSRDNTIKVWDVHTGTEVLTARGHEAGEHGGFVFAVAFSPDGKRIVSGGMDKMIRLWDAATGAELMALRGHTEHVFSTAFSSDGTRLISGGWDGMVKIWNAVTGDEILSLAGDAKRVCCVAYGPRGQRIASCGFDNTINIWDAGTGTKLLILKGHESMVWHMAFSPDGRRIASGSGDRTIKVWDASAGNELMTLRGHAHHVRSVIFSPDGRRIVSSSEDQTVKIWDAENGSELLTLRGNDDLYSVVFSPDGNRIASGSDDGTILVWESAAPTDGYEARRTGAAARKVTDKLHEELGLYAEVINKLKADSKLDEFVRKVALQIANARLWEDADDSKESVDDESKE